MRSKDLQQEILRAFLTGKPTFTRPELAELFHERQPGIVNAVDALKKANFLTEPGRTGKRTGRRAPQLALAPDAWWTAGIDFQFNGSIGVIVDFAGNLRYRAKLPAKKRGTLANCRAELRGLLYLLRDAAGKEWEKVRGVGFADPGIVDVRRGVSLQALHVPGWESARTAEWLRRETQCDAAILPECLVKLSSATRYHATGSGIFYLETGAGIGGAFYQDGRFFTGDTGSAMEIGHLIVEPGGTLCHCGNRGCLETVAGTAGLRQRLADAIAHGVDTKLSVENFSIAELAKCLECDKTARVIATECVEKIACALGTVVTLLNPAEIIIGGELTALGDFLIHALKRNLKLNTLAGATEKLKLSFLRGDDHNTACEVARLMRDRLVNRE